MNTILQAQFARFRGQIIGWSIGLGILVLMLVSFYGTIQEQADQLQALVDSYPPEMMAFFGGDFDDFTTPAGYLDAELFSFMLPITLGIFVVLAGSGLLASDEENGILDLIVAQPVSRTGLFLGRLGAFILATLGIILINWGLLVVGAVATDFPATALELLLPFAGLFALIALFGTLALLLSQILPSRRLAAMVSGMLLILTFFVTSLSNLNTDLKGVATFSPFTYYQGGDAMNGLDWTSITGLLAISILFAVLAWWRFEQRDIRVAGEGGWRVVSRRRRAPA
jgi:ABC-2 type transport system permease protein